MKLTIIAPRNRPCGIADYARLLARALPSDFQITWVELPSTPSSRKWHQIHRLANEAEIIHVHYEYGLFQTVRPFRNRFKGLMRRLKPPKIVTLHDALPELKPRWNNQAEYHLKDLLRDLAYRPFFSHWENRQYTWADHFIVHSPELAERVGHIRSPSAVSLFPIPIPTTHQQWVYPGNQGFSLATLGFVKAHKGYEDILSLLASHSTWRWIIAGGPQNQQDQQYLTQLQKKMETLGITDRITITGYLPQDQLERVSVQAQLAVFPYRWSSGSASISWAIGLGMPVIATDLPVVSAFKKAEAGVELLPLDQPSQWGAVLESFLDHPERLNQLARKNQTYTLQNGFTGMAELLTKIFYNLTEHP